MGPRTQTRPWLPLVVAYLRTGAWVAESQSTKASASRAASEPLAEGPEYASAGAGAGSGGDCVRAPLNLTAGYPGAILGTNDPSDRDPRNHGNGILELIKAGLPALGTFRARFCAL